MKLHGRLLGILLGLLGCMQAQWVPTNGPAAAVRAYDVLQVDSLIVSSTDDQVMTRRLNGSHWVDAFGVAYTFVFDHHSRFQGQVYVGASHWYSQVASGPNGVMYGSRRNVTEYIHNMAADSSSFCLSTSKGVLMGTDDSTLTTYHSGLPLVMNSGDTTHYYPVYDLALNDQYVFAGTGNGLFRASRQQMNFSILGTPPINVDAVWCRDSLVLAFVGDFTYRSTNSGLNWSQINLFALNSCNRIFEADGSIFLCTDGEGVFESTDNGVNWFRPPGISQTLSVFGGDEIDGNAFLATSKGVFRRNSGTWTWLNYDGLGFSVESMVALPSGCIAAVQGYELFITSDGGNTWTNRAFPANFYAAPMMTSLQGRLMAASDGSLTQAVLADDCNAPWDTLTFALGFGVHYLSGDGESALVNTFGDYWLVTDSGNTVQSVQRPPAQDCNDDPVIFPVDQALYATSCRDTVLLRSRDLGNTWVDCSTGLPPTDYVCYMERIGGRLFATFPNRIFQAVEGDSLWVASDIGIPGNSGPFFDLEYDGRLFYVCNGRRVWSSVDGVNWTDFSTGLPALTGNYSFSSMSLVDSVLYFGTWGYGVWKRSISVIPAGADTPVTPGPSMLLYPNPARDRLRWTGDMEPREVQCWNLMGQRIPLTLTGDGLDVSGLPAGAYVIRLQGRGATVFTGKFLKCE